MMQLFANNATSALNGGISNSATTIALTSGHGAKFPTPTGGDYFLATLIGLDGNGAEASWEIVKCTARATDSLTVVRAQESTTAATWASGSRLEARITKGALEGTVTSVTGTAPVVSSGGTTPAISMAAATASVNGYMTSTYATKLDGIAAGATANTGTVTAVSVASANGFTGSSSGGATPALTLATSITGLLKGNGTAISAAVANTDYAPVASPTFTGNVSIGSDEATNTQTIKGATTVLANSASPALKVTQTGAGNAFVVEDSDSVDGTPFVIDASGNVSTYGVASLIKSGTTGYLWRGYRSTSTSTLYAYDDGTDVQLTLGTVGALKLGTSNTIRVVIDANGATSIAAVAGDALKVTQTGSGNAFVVEDSASTDSTPFVIDGSGNVSSLGRSLFGRTYPSNERIGIGGSTSAISSATYAIGIQDDSVVSSTQTSAYTSNSTYLSTQAAAFTLATLNHYQAYQGTIGAGSSVTDQYGFNANSSLIGAANNYGFYASNTAAVTSGKISTAFYAASNIATGGGTTWNFYAAGTAPNYFAGAIGIGGTAGAGRTLQLSKTITGATLGLAIHSNGTIQSDVTSEARYFNTFVSTAASAFTVESLTHYYASQSTIGATSAVTNQFGFVANASLTGATNNYGFYSGNTAAITASKTSIAFYAASDIATGGGTTWNFYAAGTAPNYFGGKVGVGGLPSSNQLVGLSLTATGGANINAMFVSSAAQSDVTGSLRLYRTTAQTAAAAFTLSELSHFYLAQGTFGAGSTVTDQYGINIESSLTGATNNYGFFSNIASAANRYNFYAAGTAPNYFAGDIQVAKTITAAATTGAQTVNKTAGTVNFAASATSLVVTNSLVTANSIIVCTVGTVDTTMKSVVAVAGSGSFTLTANAAATAETRVNFIVIN